MFGLLPGPGWQLDRDFVVRGLRRARAPQAPSLRAQRSNPDCIRGRALDCFVARAPRNDGGESAAACPPICFPRRPMAGRRNHQKAAAGKMQAAREDTWLSRKPPPESSDRLTGSTSPGCSKCAPSCAARIRS
ncbi:hypothetical protein EHH60_14635 [Bradyrhizobium sp. RP6]|nr:hypothetical protein EHH60_14635 [Bradyrhizobium sp. RP6]